MEDNKQLHASRDKEKIPGVPHDALVAVIAILASPVKQVQAMDRINMWASSQKKLINC